MSFVLCRRFAKMNMPKGTRGLGGGFLRRATKSRAACHRKSLILTSGKFILLGKNNTVSESISALVVGIKHFTHL